MTKESSVDRAFRKNEKKMEIIACIVAGIIAVIAGIIFAFSLDTIPANEEDYISLTEVVDVLENTKVILEKSDSFIVNVENEQCKVIGRFQPENHSFKVTMQDKCFTPSEIVLISLAVSIGVFCVSYIIVFVIIAIKICLINESRVKGSKVE